MPNVAVACPAVSEEIVDKQKIELFWVKYLIPYNRPPLNKFPDPKVSIVRPLGPLLGIKISTPTAPRFGDMGAKV